MQYMQGTCVTALVTSMHYKPKHWMYFLAAQSAHRSLQDQQISSWAGDSVSSTHLMVCG